MAQTVLNNYEREREREGERESNLHIPSEAFFFKMFLTYYVLLGIFICFYVQNFYSQIVNPLFTQLSVFLWIRYCKGTFTVLNLALH